MAETKKTPKFRVSIKDVKSEKVKVITVYDLDLDLESFKEKLEKKINEI